MISDVQIHQRQNATAPLPVRAPGNIPRPSRQGVHRHRRSPAASARRSRSTLARAGRGVDRRRSQGGRVAATVAGARRQPAAASAGHGCRIDDLGAEPASPRRRAASRPLDGLVNCAAIVLHADPLEISWDDWRRQFEINLFGAYEASRLVAKSMIAAGTRGAIVSIASEAGKKGHVESLAYSASKAGLISMTRMLSEALAAHDINVNCVCPGGVATPMLREVSEAYSQVTGEGAGQDLRQDDQPAAGPPSAADRGGAGRLVPALRRRASHSRPGGQCRCRRDALLSTPGSSGDLTDSRGGSLWSRLLRPSGNGGIHEFGQGARIVADRPDTAECSWNCRGGLRTPGGRAGHEHSDLLPARHENPHARG